MTIKHENAEFLVITLKHVSFLKVVVNRPVTQKLRAITHENGHKTRKRRVSGHISQTCKGSPRHAKPTRTQKLSAITYENDHKTRKRRVFGHNSQTCIVS